MSKLLTVYDDKELLNNVISALTLEVEEVIYVYHHDVNKKTFRNINKVLNDKKEIKTSFILLQNDAEELTKIIEDNPDIIVDVGGSKYLSLKLFDLAEEYDNDIIYFDNEENVIKDYRSHTVFYKDVYKLSIEEIFNLKNGKFSKILHAHATDKETIKIIKEVVERNLNNYLAFTKYITKINRTINNARRIDVKTYALNDKQTKDIVTDSCFNRCKSLFDLENNILSFKTKKIKDMIAVSGAFLENYVYQKLIESKIFDSVEMSVVVDFSDEKSSHKVSCEIDILACKNNRLLFISCKSNKIDTADLNEIYVQENMFGNILSAPVICLCEDANTKFINIYAKAEEMGVYIVDKSNIQDPSFPKIFEKIIDGTYVYDALPV